VVLVSDYSDRIDYYPQLTQSERDEREEFAAEACYVMRDRFLARARAEAKIFSLCFKLIEMVNWSVKSYS
jgi:hypothetical protein